MSRWSGRREIPPELHFRVELTQDVPVFPADVDHTAVALNMSQSSAGMQVQVAHDETTGHGSSTVCTCPAMHHDI